MSSDNQRQGMWVFIVGPSGAGKDTVMDLARQATKGEDGIQFARRVVTRPQNAFEDHDTVSAQEFEDNRQRGDYVLWWQAHDLSYGVERHWQDKVNRGAVVACNVSRTILPGVEKRIASRAKVVLITAPPEVLAARIASRGRDSAKGSRTGRDLDGPVRQAANLVIENTGTPESAGQQLAAFLRSVQATVAA